MRNITSTYRALAKLARDRGESMVTVPTDKLAELVGHLQKLDHLVIAAEDFLAAVDDYLVSGPDDTFLVEVEDRAGRFGDALAAFKEAQS